MLHTNDGFNSFTLASGTTTIVNPVKGQVIEVYKFVVWAQTGTTLTFNFVQLSGTLSGFSNTVTNTIAINPGGFNFAAQNGFTYDADFHPLVSPPGYGFQINNSSNATVTGWVQFDQGQEP